MHGLVPDDARCTGNEEDFLARRINQRGARKGRAARPIFGRIVVGADLAWIFDRHCGQLAGHEGDRERATGQADGASRRHVARSAAGKFEKSVLTADIELPIALQTTDFLVDPGQVIPYPPQLRQALVVEQAEDAPVGFLARCLQRRGSRGKGVFIEFDDTVEQVTGPSPDDAFTFASRTGRSALPDFLKLAPTPAEQRRGNDLLGPGRCGRRGQFTQTNTAQHPTGDGGQYLIRQTGKKLEIH